MSWHPLPEVFRELAAGCRGAVLLETAKQDGEGDRSVLFLDPVDALIAWSPGELDEVLRRVDEHVADGLFVAGFFNYECGEHFMGMAPSGGSLFEPLAWLGVFEAPIVFDHCSGAIRGTLPATADGSERGDAAVIRTDGMRIGRDAYGEAIARIHGYLEAGDTYQVNFTDRVEGETDSDPLAVYRTLLRQQPVPFAAYLNRPNGPILSFSPELFFRTAEGRIIVRPMKGTWPRGVNLVEDREAEARLLHDEKNRSEHVMIVDLLRNDLGRICTYGSVRVDELFRVERYTTLLQMTSTWSGLLREGLSPAQVLVSLFPSGSITGAPKRRTMEIIRELEGHPRGVYTGCIGFFGPHGEACFNVAIRTVTMDGRHLTMGVGGGITADSIAEDEFEECRLKAGFLTKRQTPFSLIETMRAVDGEIPLLASHMQRLASSAQYFGILYEEEILRSELELSVRGRGGAENRVRLLLHETGAWTIAVVPLEAVVWSGRLLLAEERTRAGDVWLHHKTSHRELYERNLAMARRLGFDEVLFLNEEGELTEGAISNVFLQMGEGWVTPRLLAGVLPGVQRASLLAQLPDVEEREVWLEDLAGAESVFLCNALRGVRDVTSIETLDGRMVWKKRID